VLILWVTRWWRKRPQRVQSPWRHYPGRVNRVLRFCPEAAIMKLNGSCR